MKHSARNDSLSLDVRRLLFAIIAVLALNAGMGKQLTAQIANDEAGARFAPTIPSKKEAPGPAPAGMVWITGGEFSMGSPANGGGSGEMPMESDDAGPVHRV